MQPLRGPATDFGGDRRFDCIKPPIVPTKKVEDHRTTSCGVFSTFKLFVTSEQLTYG